MYGIYAVVCICLIVLVFDQGEQTMKVDGVECVSMREDQRLGKEYRDRRRSQLAIGGEKKNEGNQAICDVEFYENTHMVYRGDSDEGREGKETESYLLVVLNYIDVERLYTKNILKYHLIGSLTVKKKDSE